MRQPLLVQMQHFTRCVPHPCVRYSRCKRSPSPGLRIPFTVTEGKYHWIIIFQTPRSRNSSARIPHRYFPVCECARMLATCCVDRPASLGSDGPTGRAMGMSIGVRAVRTSSSRACFRPMAHAYNLPISGTPKNLTVGLPLFCCSPRALCRPPML